MCSEADWGGGEGGTNFNSKNLDQGRPSQLFCCCLFNNLDQKKKATFKVTSTHYYSQFRLSAGPFKKMSRETADRYVLSVMSYSVSAWTDCDSDNNA